MRKASACFALFILFTASSGCSLMEESERCYESSEAARAANKEKGWMPALLPDAANHICERHDIDTNTQWLSFAFSSENWVPTNCKPAQISSLKIPEAPRNILGIKRPWWHLSAAATSSNEFLFYTCDEGSLLVNKAKREAHYWR